MSRVLAPGDRRLWLLRSVALRIDRRANPLWIFEVYHRRLAVALLTLAFAGWLVAVSGLFFWLNRVPHNQVGWLDLAAPWRWSGLRAKRGDTAILMALDELKERDYSTAYYNLRVGLSRSPANVEGRVTLARLTAGQDPARTVAILEEGLAYAGQDSRLIGALLGAYGSFRMHTRGLAFVEQRLRETPPPDLAQLLGRARVELLMELGRRDEAVQAYAALPARSAPTREQTLADIDLELRLGRAEEARRKLAPLLGEASAPPVVWRQAIDAAIPLGDDEAVTTALRHLRAAAPTDPGPYLLAHKAWHQLQRASLRDAAEQDFYRLFRGSDGAMQAFAAQAVLLDLPDVLTRIQRAASASRLSPFAFRVHRTELALRRGDIDGAARFLREWENDVDTLGARQRFHPEYIKRLTRAASIGTPDLVSFLLTQLTSARGFASLAAYQLAARVLEQAGNPAGAADIVRAGLQVYPQSDPLMKVQAHLTELLGTAEVRPNESPRSASELAVIPASLVEARARLAGLMKSGDFAASRDLVKAIRAQKPAWMPTMENELALYEVELAYALTDPLASRMAARGYLDRNREEEAGLALVAVAVRLNSRGETAKARALAEEIRSASGLPQVQQALRETKLLADAAASQTPAEVLAELDALASAGKWAEAEKALKRVRDNPPDWAAASLDLRTREVRIRLGLDQRPLALATLKELVLKSGAPRSAAFALVREMSSRGERESALLLAREIVRLLPGDAAAARLVQEVEAAKSAGP